MSGASRTRTARVVVSGVPSRADVVVQGAVSGSRSFVRGLFDHGCVTIDDVPAESPGLIVDPGAVVVVTWDPGRRYAEKPRSVRHPRAFRVAFEDPHLIVVEKHAGVLTVPTERRERNALVDEIGRYLSKGDRITKKAYLVHRLDRDTSGLLVFGKSPAVAAALKDQFAAKKPEREYVAYVAGALEDDRGTIESWLATDEDLDQYSTDDVEEGKHAVTHFTVVERVRGATVLSVRLETGRRNQIRVHFAERGHPVLGDVRYRPELARHPDWTWKRLALHAAVLGLVHPVTNAPLVFRAPPPQEFQEFLKRTHRRVRA